MNRRNGLVFGLIGALVLVVIWLFVDGWRMRQNGTAAVPVGASAAGVDVPPTIPTEPRWAFACEQHWLGTEIAQAIVDLAGSAVNGRLTHVTDLGVVWRPADGIAGTFTVSRPNAQLTPVVVTNHLWSPATWAPMASELLRGVTPATPTDAQDVAVLRALTTPTPAALADQSAAVSAALAGAMRDPAMHERAALVLAVFALREEADAFSDVRATLGRLTAHLAVASALRGSQPAGTAGTVAAAIEAVLLGRQAEAVAIADAGTLAGQAAAAPWRTVVRLRATGDWRGLRTPAGATMVERLEYLRAVRERRSTNVAQAFLERFEPEPVPDWGRILIRGGANVEAGNRVFDGVNAAEALEVRTVADRLGHDLGKDAMLNDPIGVINALPAVGPIVIVQGQPVVRVLDWGTWAAFFQRHLAARLMLESYHYRRTLGDPERERAHNQAIVEQYGGLRLTPLVRRYVATDAAEYEAVMAEAKTLCVDHPDAVTAPNWMLLMEKPDHARLRPALPDEAAWFSPSLPAGTAFQTEPRLWGPGHSRRPTLESHRAVAALKPFDLDLAWDAAVLEHGEHPPLEALDRVYAPFSAYDLRALRGLSSAAIGNPVRFEQITTAMCDLNADSCQALAAFYAQSGQSARAAAVFERWVRDARDRVGVSNGLGWLVTYYRGRGQRTRARALAEMAADVYSYSGLTLYARQLECDGEYAAAEANYLAAGERYRNNRGLLAFYLRQAGRDPRGPWLAKAAPIERELLGGRLERLDTATLQGPPSGGVVLTNAGVAARRAGLAIGDIIVGVDGYRVPTYNHYTTVESLGERDEVVFDVWRRDHYERVRGSFPQRYFPITLDTYQPRR